ncbi:hypothetical protein AB0N29_19685 [Nocardioides sp. NPDC092400]|uniref:hypothetical protein n=1 Tax=Nocardioides sp. NPDC092400 TaxID=3155196 RepID=UPI00342AA5A4
MLNVQARAHEQEWQVHQVLGPGDRRTYELVLNPQHGQWLLDLAGLYDLTWATTWWTVANERIAPLLGLPPLPAVPLPAAFGNRPDHYSAKTPHVRRWARGRALAWIDDDIDERDAIALTKDWTGHRLEVMRADPPLAAVLTIGIDPTQGLQPGHISQLRLWSPNSGAP